MAKRGRRIGQTVNVRDERGWMIPRAGTVRLRVYNMMVQGKGVAEIHKALRISYAVCLMHQRHITQTARVNAQKYNAEHPDEPPVPVPGDAKWNDALEAAAKVADAFAEENQRMATDTIMLDPMLNGEPVTSDAVRASKDLMIEGCIHSSMFHAAQNIATAIRALRRVQ